MGEGEGEGGAEEKSQANGERVARRGGSEAGMMGHSENTALGRTGSFARGAAGRERWPGEVAAGKSRTHSLLFCPVDRFVGTLAPDAITASHFPLLYLGPAVKHELFEDMYSPPVASTKKSSPDGQNCVAHMVRLTTNAVNMEISMRRKAAPGKNCDAPGSIDD